MLFKYLQAFFKISYLHFITQNYLLISLITEHLM